MRDRERVPRAEAACQRGRRFNSIPDGGRERERLCWFLTPEAGKAFGNCSLRPEFWVFFFEPTKKTEFCVFFGFTIFHSSSTLLWPRQGNGQHVARSSQLNLVFFFPSNFMKCLIAFKFFFLSEKSLKNKKLGRE